MRKLVQLLNEAGFAVFVVFGIILAFFLMTGDIALRIIIKGLFSEFSAKFVRQKKLL